MAEDRKASAVECCVELAQDFGAEIIGERFHVLGVSRENDAAMCGHVQTRQTVRGHVEIGGHAALAGDASAERYGAQRAVQFVGPLMIWADEFADVAGELAAEFCPAVGATVLHDVDRAILAARDDHRRGADVGADEVARVRDLGFQRDVVPGAAVEDARDSRCAPGARASISR